MARVQPAQNQYDLSAGFEFLRRTEYDPIGHFLGSGLIWSQTWHRNCQPDLQTKQLFTPLNADSEPVGLWLDRNHPATGLDANFTRHQVWYFTTKMQRHLIRNYCRAQHSTSC